MTRVMFVCLGNICRSPAAEGILLAKLKEQNLADEITVASSGLGSWHVGDLPDARMREAARARGIELTSRAQQFQESDFQTYDHILAADQPVLEELRRLANGPQDLSRLALITAYSARFPDNEVPDPYYADLGAFDEVLDMLDDACSGLLERLS